MATIPSRNNRVKTAPLLEGIVKEDLNERYPRSKFTESFKVIISDFLLATDADEALV